MYDIYSVKNPKSINLLNLHPGKDYMCLDTSMHVPYYSLEPYTGLDIGYVPAVPNAFLRLSGQFGPPQFIFHWPKGPVFFFFFIIFF